MIDRLVYKLYGLTYQEVKIINPEFKLTEQEYKILKQDKKIEKVIIKTNIKQQTNDFQYWQQKLFGQRQLDKRGHFTL
jgi:hypothetical protein